MNLNEAAEKAYKSALQRQHNGADNANGESKLAGIKRVSICISGQPEQIEELKKMAALERKTVSAFIFEKTGVMK